MEYCKFEYRFLNIYMLTILLSGLLAHPIYQQTANSGGNVTLPCLGKRPGDEVSWIRDGKVGIGKAIVQNSTLVIKKLSKEDGGLYKCTASSHSTSDRISEINLRVRGEPGAVGNLTAIPSSVTMTLRWTIDDDGGFPIKKIVIRYEHIYSGTSEWHYVQHALFHTSATEVDVYQLKPNSTYLFEIWLENEMGRGESARMIAQTLNDVGDNDLARRLLEGRGPVDASIWFLAGLIVALVFAAITATFYYAVVLKDLQHITCKYSKDPERIELIPNVIANPVTCQEPEEMRKDGAEGLAVGNASTNIVDSSYV